MSVLLDALKKAALEKRKRDAMLARRGDNSQSNNVENDFNAGTDHSDFANTNSENTISPEFQSNYCDSNDELAESFISTADDPQSSGVENSNRHGRHIIETSVDFDQTMIAEKEKLFGEEELKLDVDFDNPHFNEDESDQQQMSTVDCGEEPEQIVYSTDSQQSQDILLTTTPADSYDDTASDEPEKNTVENPSAQDQDYAEEHQSNATESDSEPKPAISPQSIPTEEIPQNTKERAVTSAPTVDNTTTLTLEPKANTLEFAEELLAEIEGETDAANHKITFLSLVERNKKAFARSRKKFLLLMSLLSVVATVLLSAYFYLVTQESNSLGGSITATAINLNSPVTEPALSDAVAASDEYLDEVSQDEEHLIIENAPDLVNKADLAADSERATQQSAVSKVASPSQNQEISEPIKSTDQTVGGKINTPNKEQIPATEKTRNALSQDSTSSPTSMPQRIALNSRPSTRANPFAEAISKGFGAYQAGDISLAQSHYRQALELRPDHRDALLGSAGIAVAQGNYQQALNYYQKVLLDAPNDSFAQAGVLAIASAGDYSPGLLSQVNFLLKSYPDAPHLYFLQGVLYSKSQRWSEAQAAFFNAWRLQPNRGDYTYNLAIALDHLGQSREALKYYRQVRQQAHTSIAPINLSALDLRIQQIEAGNE